MESSQRDSLAERYYRMRSETQGTTLVAVSKSQPLERVHELWKLGHRDFGENYVQELIEKDAELRSLGCDSIRWHFIGRLQRNKVKSLLPLAHAIHSVDSLELAQEIQDRSRGNPISCFVSVNVDREPQKSGLLPEEVPEFCSTLKTLQNISLVGLMCIPDPKQDSRKAYQALAQLGRKLSLPMLSMGMSHDYRVAIAEGATHVRVGTALFGERHS